MAKKSSKLSDEHKEAMARGRKAAAAVGAYIEALGEAKPKRGRQISLETLKQRLAEAQAVAESGSGLELLNAQQDIIDLESRIEAAEGTGVDLEALEKDFVEWAPVYAENKGISYAAFRRAGVPAATLKAAGISR